MLLCIMLTCRCIAVSAVVETGVAMILTLLVLDPQGMGILHVVTMPSFILNLAVSIFDKINFGALM